MLKYRVYRGGSYLKCTGDMTYTVYGGWVVRHDVYSVRGVGG